MEKENGDGSDAASKQPPDGLLDAAGLFGAYWGRDGGAGGGAAAQAQAQAQAQAALFGFGGARYPPPTTLGVAANQAAQLGLHPAASAAWWSMASHLAAQDYLARLQASGLNFPHLGDPYSTLSALSGVGMTKQPQKPAKPQKGGDRSGRSSSASSGVAQKEKPPVTSSATSQPSMRSSYGFPKTSSPSTHHSQQSLSSLASLNSLVGAPHQSKSNQTKQTSSAQQSHSRSSYGFPKTSSPSTQQSFSSLASLDSLVSAPHQSKPNQSQQSGSAHQSHSRSSYGFPETTQSTQLSQQSLSSLASLNSLVGTPHQSNPKQSSSAHKSHSRSKPSSSSASGQKGAKERELALLRGDLMLAQAAAQGAYHAAVAAAAKGKNISSLYPFGMGGSDKDRHGAIDSLTGLPHTILSDPASVLGGVRLPPDTEIIKYTSSLAGPKAVPGTTNRGRKKTISLDPPQVSVHPSNERGQPVPSKRQKVDEYGNSRSAVEVIRLPNRPDRQNSMPGAGTPPPNLSDYAGISRELLQTIASQSGVSLAALEKQLAGTAAATADSGLNLSTKSSGSTEVAPSDIGKTTGVEDDAPLNLSLKPTPSSSQASDALSRLTSLSSSLNASTSADRISRRKPGAKPRRVLPEPNAQIPEAPRPKSSGSEDSELSGWPSREGRPRNLGRGVSKPKKNTVASLLAQSRALGLRPALAQQLLAETDLEKLKALLGEAASTDSECPSDSCPSDSDASESGRRPQDPQLRLPLALGWKRTTVIKGLSRNCNIKGDVSYTPPEPHSGLRLKSLQDIQAFLSANPCGPLTAESFSLSARIVLGEYVQPSPEPGEPRTLNEAEITKRLEEARALAALTGGRPTPPPVDRRIELARRQQAARDARRDATARSRDQARLVRELERTERAELAKRDKEVRGQQLLEHINKNRTQLTIEPLPAKPDSDWKLPDLTGSTAKKDRRIPPISLTLIPVNGPKDACNIPIKTINLDRKDWREDLEEYSYNALDKMRDFAEKAAFDLPKGSNSKQFNFSLTKARKDKLTGKENSLERLIETYSRISEFINGCDWSKTKSPDKKDAKSIEKTYLDAKNEFMSENLMLMPKQAPKEVIDLSEDDDNILTDIITKKIGRGTFNVGRDGALSISVHPTGTNLAKRRKHEEAERQKVEEQTKRQQDRELKRQQAMLLKEQQKYITEERERRRQHTTFIRQLDARRRWEERERKKHQNLLDRLLVKEKKLQCRRKEMELLSELRRPQEDSTLPEQKPLPTLNRIPGLKVPGQAMAHLLHVFEFLHTFGHTLGFDMETMPTLNTLQTALLPECGMEAEEELLRVLGVLLLTASEDPGIPHPGRHTTLLGHALRMGDVTDMNVSEVLRIYLYANATGEVKALTGLSAERERERRIADHHQTDAEMQHTCANTKNLAYYEQLHNNSTYKLSEALRDKPYLALNPTTKAQILAYICDELLQNKLVLRQIDASLEHLNQLKKERYLLDMKIRKVRVLHQRKVRSEQSERQQALALERMQRLVEESANSINQTGDEENLAQNTTDPKPEDKDKPEEAESEKETATPHTPPSPQLDSDKELSSLKEVANSMKGKEMLNNNKDECSPPENLKDKDSVMEDCDAVLSDLESEGTQPEEDEDKNLSSEELARKLEKLLRQSEQQLQQVSAGTHALRATCHGQDRYWRRYWSLGKSGGIFVEAMESAQPEILGYHHALESSHASKERREVDTRKRRPKKGAKKELTQSEADKMEAESESQRTQEALKSELELKNIKSELNLSDHTQIIKYEPNMKHHGTGKISGSSIKMEEKYIQRKQTKEEEDMLDIEDSIPTAFLVQKPTHKPMFATQAESLDKPQEIVKVENLVKNETVDTQEPGETKDQLVDNLEELRKMAEAVSSQLDAAKKAEAEIKEEVKEEKADVKKEIMEPDAADAILQAKMLEGKWFSILRHERSFLSNIHEPKQEEQFTYHDNEQTCSEVIHCQGHKWDVSNNLHLLNDPSLFTLNSMVTSVQVPSNSVYADSTLTLSGLDQDLLEAGMCKDVNGEVAEEKDEGKKEDDNDLEKELNADAWKHEAQQRAKASGLSSLGLLNFNALSTYVTCDSPPPIQMSAEEMEQLESCKVHGLPKKQEGTFVPKELRHGWWRITDPEQLKDLMEALHPRGVRERELYAALLQHVPTVSNKLVIDKGDIHATELSLSHLDRVIAQNGGYPRPDSPNSFTPATARKIDMDLLGLVEALEERVAAAAMQVKGWRPERFPLPEDATGAEIVARARHKLAAVEAHIERRYLKPPLVQRYASSADAAIGAALQAEQQGNNSAPSPQTSDGSGETKENTKGVSRGLATWREAVARCNTSAQLAMLLQALEAGVAWDKSIMKANCQFCLCGDNDDQLLLCDGCDKGYHTYCFKPSMDKIPEGDWYCWECVNKARGDRVCIVCGGQQGGRTIHCALCPRAYHQDCHYPPLGKNPRGKWYCQNCIARAPAKRPRTAKKRDSRQKDTSNSELDHTMVPSPAPSHASTSTTAEECPPSVTHTPEKCPEPENGLDHRRAPAPDFAEEEAPPPEKRRRETSRDATREASLQATREASLQATREASLQATREASLQATREASHQTTKEAGVQFGGNGALEHEEATPRSENDTSLADVYSFPGEEQDAENVPLLSRAKKEKTTAKRHSKEMQACKSLLCEMECHEHAWPFLLPVNTKLFPQYKKVIKTPMDLSTIKKKLQDSSYKSKDEFATDVRLIFSNCEVFNEDDSPVGRAGHHMRQFFDQRWTLI